MRGVIRRALVAALVVVALTACGSSESSSTEPAPTTSTTPGTVPASTTSTTDAPTTTTVAVTTSSTTTSTTTTVPTYELAVWAAPADGQWFSELPIPWVFAVWPEQEDPPRDADGVPGATGWAGQGAVVSINGLPADAEECHNCVYGRGDVVMWRMDHGVGDPFGWGIGENLVVIEATFTDGVVAREDRMFHYDPTLAAFTGWMVELDREAPSLTFAAATFEPFGEDDTHVGPVTSVADYPIRDDAAFILLDPDSGGQPPASVIDFEEFTRLLDASVDGCPPSDEPWENQCFFASDYGYGFFTPPDKPGYPFIIYITEDGEVQQLEQTWGP